MKTLDLPGQPPIKSREIVTRPPFVCNSGLAVMAPAQQLMKVPGHLQIEEVRLPPGQEWTDAAAAWRFVLVRHGAAYWLGAPARSLSEGEMVLAAPGVAAVLRASQIGEVILATFSFAPDTLCGFFTLAERQLFGAGGADPARQAQVLPSTHPVTQQFAWLVRTHAKQHSLAARIEMLGLVAAVFDEALARHPAPEPLGATALERFNRLIAQMPDAEIISRSPEELARLCGCSPRHFNRLFRKQFGASARERQTEVRLLKARQLLREPNAKIADAARESGYQNLGLFNALFKKRFGVTPSQWRSGAARPDAPAPGAGAAGDSTFRT